jgi:hypothetical protein
LTAPLEPISPAQASTSLGEPKNANIVIASAVTVSLRIECLLSG